MALTRHNRIRGCLLGGAVGDALGGPVEFVAAAQIERMGGVLNVPFPGKITDDTQMTLFTLEGLLLARAAGSADVIAFMKPAYRRWYRTQTEPFADDDGWLLGHRDLWSRRAPGNTCMSALSGEDVRTDSKGCGGVMRVAPIGLASDAPWGMAAAAAAITHGHPTSSAASGAFALIVSRLARSGDTLTAAIDFALTDLGRRPDADETIAAVSLARDLAMIPGGAGIPRQLGPRINGGGWIAEEALAIAIYAVLVERDPVKALARAVEHDGDSDSTGAIAGNILGAWLGADWIPASWLEKLELRDVIEQMAADLAGLAMTPDVVRRYS